MHPKLWTIPLLNLPIYSYGFMVMLGFLAGILVATQRAKKNGLSPDIIFDLGIVLMIAGIVGARIAYIIIFNDQFAGSWQIFNIFDEGGLNLIGVIIGWFIPFGIYLWRLKKITLRNFGWLIPISIVSAVLIGRICQVILNRKLYGYDFAIFEIWKGGLVFYGGLILAIATGIYYLKLRGLRIWFVGDIIAPSVALGLAFGRLGCFLNGCCYGKLATGNTLGICFPNLAKGGGTLAQHNPVFATQLHEGMINSNATSSLPVIPTQLYESIFALCLFVFFSFLLKKKLKEGLVLWLFVLLYSLGRFIIEFYRGDKGSVVLGLTDSQTISAALFIIGLIFLIYVIKRPAPLEMKAGA